MTIDTFAEKYHVKTKKDDCGDVIIAGKLWKQQPESQGMNPARKGKLQYGHHLFEAHLFEHDAAKMGVMLSFQVDNGHEIGSSGRSAKWNNARKKLIAAGFTIRQEGDAEGIALFDPDNKSQSKLALKLAGVRLRRELTQEQRIALAGRLAAARAKKETIPSVS